MNLYIQTENGNAINHPAFEDNLIQAFGKVPDHWEAFIRVERPVPTIYQVLDSQEPTYQKINDIWTDVWAIRDMTANEIIAKQQKVKNLWGRMPNASNFTAWTFNEATCQYEPPIPKPEGVFKWDGATNSWIALPLPITV